MMPSKKKKLILLSIDFRIWLPLAKTATKVLETELKEDNISFIFSGTIGPVRDLIFKSNLIEIIDKKMMFSSVDKAMYFIDNEINLNENIDNKIATQANN